MKKENYTANEPNQTKQTKYKNQPRWPMKKFLKAKRFTDRETFAGFRVNDFWRLSGCRHIIR